MTDREHAAPNENARTIAAEAYQVIGALDVLDEPQVIRALDYFNAVANGEQPESILPFTSCCADTSKLQGEVRELKAWKESSIRVQNEWDKVWEAAGKPGALGASKAESVLHWLRTNAQIPAPPTNCRE